MAVRLVASIPRVTCSAVEADPNPLGPGHPVISEMIAIDLFSIDKSHTQQRLLNFPSIKNMIDEQLLLEIEGLLWVDGEVAVSKAETVAEVGGG